MYISLSFEFANVQFQIISIFVIGYSLLSASEELVQSLNVTV